MLPLGFFDPLGYTKLGDEEGFRKLRVAELKHGRVAMMATLGELIQPVDALKIPGFEKVPSGVGAIVTPPGTYGLLAVLLLSGVLELFVWKQDPNVPVGDFGDPWKVGWLVTTETGDVDSPDMRERELNNGRFAMFAALGVIAAELATGKNAYQQLGLRVPELATGMNWPPA